MKHIKLFEEFLNEELNEGAIPNELKAYFDQKGYRFQKKGDGYVISNSSLDADERSDSGTMEKISIIDKIKAAGGHARLDGAHKNQIHFNFDVNEAEDFLTKINAKYKEKIDTLSDKAHRHYNKGEEVSQEDIEDILIPLTNKMKQAEITLAKMEAAKKPQDEARIKKMKEMIQKLEDEYDEEYQNYLDDVDRERMDDMD